MNALLASQAHHGIEGEGAEGDEGGCDAEWGVPLSEAEVVLHGGYRLQQRLYCTGAIG